jgi:hypothetical protein
MGRFTVTAPGTPPPTFTEAGKLPAGVSLAASGILGGMPSTGTGGTYHITITARNGTATIAGAPASTAKGKSNLIRLTATNGVAATITQRFTLKIA